MFKKQKSQLMNDLAKDNFPVPTSKANSLQDSTSTRASSISNTRDSRNSSPDRSFQSKTQNKCQSSFFSMVPRCHTESPFEFSNKIGSSSFLSEIDNDMEMDQYFVKNENLKVSSEKKINSSQYAKDDMSPRISNRRSNSLMINELEGSTEEIKRAISSPSSSKKEITPKKKNLVINGDWAKGMKGGVILYTISSFRQNVSDKMSNHQQFLEDVQDMLDYCDKNPEEMRSSHAESIAGVIILLVASQCGVKKSDFIEALKPLKKRMFKKTDLIKQARCWRS